MVLNIILIVAVVILLAGLFVWFGTNRKDAGKAISVIAGIVVVGVLIGMFAGVTFTVGGLAVVPGAAVGAGCLFSPETKSIENFTALATEFGSNDPDDFDGNLFVYNAGDDPSKSTTKAILTVNINDGNGTDTSNKLSTCTNYRVVIGSTDYYDEDLGVIQFDTTAYNEFTATLTYNVPNLMVEFATIDSHTDINATASQDIDGEVDSAGYTNSVNNDVNELVYDVANDKIVYDVSDGDGIFKTEVDIGFSGGNKAIRNPVLCFENDSSNEPEGDEYTAISVQSFSGAVYGGMPGDLIDAWINEDCILLTPPVVNAAEGTSNPGGDIKSGTTGTYRFTFTVNEANVDANDDWFEILDDLGDNLGKDVLLSSKKSSRIRDGYDHRA